MLVTAMLVTAMLVTVNHCQTCKLGGFVALRHDSLKHTTAKLLDQVCKDVEVEPALLNITVYL